MSYENPRQPEDINVSGEHPLKEFFILLLGVTALVVVAVFILAGAAQLLAPHIPFEVEQRIVESVDVAQLYDPESTVAHDDPRQVYLSELAARLATHMSLPQEMRVSVTLSQTDAINAYASLGGQIVVFSGLLDRMPHENALAMVLAHEIAHVKLRHPIVALGRGLTVAVALSSVFGLTDNAAASGLVEWIGVTSTLSFSRAQEQAADELAIEAVIAAYGHLTGAADTFRVLGGGSADEGQSVERALDFLQTHPNLAARSERVEALAADLGVSGRVVALPRPAD